MINQTEDESKYFTTKYKRQLNFNYAKDKLQVMEINAQDFKHFNEKDELERKYHENLDKLVEHYKQEIGDVKKVIV